MLFYVHEIHMFSFDADTFYSVNGNALTSYV